MRHWWFVVPALLVGVALSVIVGAVVVDRMEPTRPTSAEVSNVFFNGRDTPAKAERWSQSAVADYCAPANQRRLGYLGVVRVTIIWVSYRNNTETARTTTTHKCADRS